MVCKLDFQGVTVGVTSYTGFICIIYVYKCFMMVWCDLLRFVKEYDGV